VPDTFVEIVCGVNHERVKRYRQDHGIEPYANRRNHTFPEWYGAWVPMISAWGPERARAWVSEHSPQHADSIERDMRPLAAGGTSSRSTAKGRDSRRGAEWRKLNTQLITCAIAKREAGESGVGGDVRFMHRPQVTPREVSAREPVGQAETVAEFLARGGRVTKLVGAGQANVGQVAS
jgi:hypothetical protein